jgi:hypothetical protein
VHFPDLLMNFISAAVIFVLSCAFIASFHSKLLV